VKIIATMGTSKYLAEVDGFELRELNSDVKIEVGAEFEIRKAAETLAALRGLSKNKLIYVKKQIDDLQKKFQEIEQTYDAVMLLDTIKNSEES
jgi:uncharacterized membrane protein